MTLHAYECSFGGPYGHHNVFFRGQPGPLVYPDRSTLPELWKLLEAGNALTIPHHTGKFPSGIDFGYHDPAFRRNFEICSGHGLSEAYNPVHPLSFEHSDFTVPSQSLTSPTFAVDAWKRGLILSTIASSDDHRGQPGQPQYGLVAVRAPALTRDDVFQSLFDRHTYGTSGAKIIFEFRVAGTEMGQTAQPESAPQIEVRALGTEEIARVEVLKLQSPAEQFEVIRSWTPATLDFATTFRDDDFKSGAIYYARLQQKKLIRSKAVFAWSSPVWTEPGAPQ